MKLGLPYMGSKRKLSKKIVDTIILQNPKVKYVYDLFGGGGAISFELLKRKQIKKVVYNELNTGVVELLKDVLSNCNKDKYYNWVSRDEFHDNKDKEDWFAGLCKTCWSFGNNQKDYMYGKDLEEPKRLLHLAVIEQNNKYLDDYQILTGIQLNKSALKHKNIMERVYNLTTNCDIKDKVTIENIIRIQSLCNINNVLNITGNSKLEISNKSYEDVIIDTPIDETVLYLDPPYKDTGKYQKDIDHEKFYDYVRSSPYKIYISSYDTPFYKIASFYHRCTLSASANYEVEENLYSNINESNNIIYSEKGESYKTVNIWNM